MKILFGTSNPAKISWTKNLLKDFDIEVITPKDLGIIESPQEDGKTALENAKIKCEFYAKYYPNVLTHDSGLIFDELDIQDLRQPGVHIRRPHNHAYLNDREMIKYYSELVTSLGGLVHAYYQDAVVIKLKDDLYTKLICDKNKAFVMLGEASKKMIDGWPLDSLSKKDLNSPYFSEKRELEEKINQDDYQNSQYYQFYKEVFKQ